MGEGHESVPVTRRTERGRRPSDAAASRQKANYNFILTGDGGEYVTVLVCPGNQRGGNWKIKHSLNYSWQVDSCLLTDGQT